MKKSSSTLLIFTIVIAAALASLMFYQNMKVDPAALNKLNATVFSTPRIISPFELIDHTGKVFNQDSFKGNWSFVFFGFTNCPDVCPATLTTLNLVMTVLKDTSKETELPRVLMISVDPERDTVEQLSKYMPYFNKNFIGLTTNDTKVIETITRQFGIVYILKKKSPDDTEYTVDHSSAIFLINPYGNLHALMSAPHDARRIAEEFTLIRAVHEQ